MKIEDVKKLHQKKYRNELGHFLVEGEHLVQELEKVAQNNPLFDSTKLFVTENYQRFNSRFEKTTLTHKQITQLSDTKTPQGIIAVVPSAAIKALAGEANKNKRAIYLHEIQDPGNLGTILRTLAWFGGFQCLLGPNSVDPFNSKVVRASMGAIFHVPMELDVSLETLSKRFEHIACIDIQGKSVSSESFQESDCLIFGNEARGLPHEALAKISTETFSIKGAGNIESLNLATAVNVCVYELNRLN